jgi:4-hydroxy 2-oxovalerate aldolase
MKPISILDCTLRDGGYYTNWDFNSNLVETYLRCFNRLPVEYLEIGYRSMPLKGYLGEYFYCPDHVLDKVKSISSKKIAVMLNEKDVRTEHVSPLLDKVKGKIDLVRLAVDPRNIDRAVELAKKIRELHFQVGFNIMYMSKWKGQPEFLDKLHQVDGIIDFLYMVDSYGGVYPADVREIFSLLRERVEVPIGFHGHNNMELALINSLTAYECGASMIDATITGMGRGAGNLKTELLLTALNAKGLFDINFNALSDIIHLFEEMQAKYLWGTNLPYMVSGANSLPQKEVMEWVSKRFFSYNSIIQALHAQRNADHEAEKFRPFEKDRKFKNVLVIGGGPSINEHLRALKLFIERNEDLALIHSSSRNAAGFKEIRKQQYFCLVGNEGSRLEKVFTNLGDFNGQCVLPCRPRKMGTYVPEMVRDKTRELSKPEFTDALGGTHTALALETAIELNAENIFLAGYDGYSSAMLSNRDLELFNENERLFSRFIQFTGTKLISLTPTLYKNLEADSVYSKI